MDNPYGTVIVGDGEPDGEPVVIEGPVVDDLSTMRPTHWTWEGADGWIPFAGQ